MFSITVATSDAVKVDPLTGAARPVDTATLKYQLESGMVKRVTPSGPPGSAPVAARPKPAEPIRIVIRARERAAGVMKRSAGIADSAEEICDRGHHDFLFLKGELGKDGQRQYLGCGALTLRKGPGGVSQASQGRLLMQRQRVVNL